MRAGVAVGFGIGAALVLWAFLRQHSTATEPSDYTPSGQIDFWDPDITLIGQPLTSTGEGWIRSMGVH